MLTSRDHRAVREVAALVDTRAPEALVEQDPPELIAQHLLGRTYRFTAEASAGEREALRQRAVGASAVTFYAGLDEFPEPTAWSSRSSTPTGTDSAEAARSAPLAAAT
jgi:hypothetical protein